MTTTLKNKNFVEKMMNLVEKNIVKSKNEFKRGLKRGISVV